MTIQLLRYITSTSLNKRELDDSLEILAPDDHGLVSTATGKHLAVLGIGHAIHQLLVALERFD